MLCETVVFVMLALMGATFVAFPGGVSHCFNQVYVVLYQLKMLPRPVVAHPLTMTIAGSIWIVFAVGWLAWRWAW